MRFEKEVSIFAKNAILKRFQANETNLSDNINQNTDIFIIFNYSIVFTMRSAHLPQLIQP